MERSRDTELNQSTHGFDGTQELPAIGKGNITVSQRCGGHYGEVQRLIKICEFTKSKVGHRPTPCLKGMHTDDGQHRDCQNT